MKMQVAAVVVLLIVASASANARNKRQTSDADAQTSDVDAQTSDVDAAVNDIPRHFRECYFVREEGRLSGDVLSGLEFSVCQAFCSESDACRSFSYGAVESEESGDSVSECVLSSEEDGERAEASEGFYVYTRSDEGCVNLTLECRSDTMLVSIDTTETFSGLVYTESSTNPGCIVDITEENSFAIEVPLLEEECNTTWDGATMFNNTIVIQWNDFVVTRTDRRVLLTCKYDITNLPLNYSALMPPHRWTSEVSNRIVNTDPAERDDFAPGTDGKVLEALHSVVRPPSIMTLITTDGTLINEAAVGEMAVLRIQLEDEESPFEIFARSCHAIDGDESLALIDDAGCPVDETIFPAFRQMGRALQANFQAFRFRETFHVTFECIIDYCLDECEPVDCGEGLMSMGKRRKRRSAGRWPAWSTTVRTLPVYIVD